MTQIVAFRIGELYCPEPRGPEARPVTLVIKEGVEVYRGLDGALLAARPQFLRNVPIATAIQLGWCWLQE